nr:hypothetical protein [Pandoravirus massiliensis]
MIALTWRRSVVTALVLLGALAAAAVVCASTIVLRYHLQQGAQTHPNDRNRTDSTNTTTGGGDGDDDDDDRNSPKGPTTGEDGCASILRARRCASRCDCVWCPPGAGFGCHEFVAGARPCGAREGRRRTPWACDAHVVTWLAVGGAGLVCAFFVGLAGAVWCLWPRLCRRGRDRWALAVGAHMDPTSPLIERRRAINGGA